jgi:hypothetical protein
VEALKPIRNEPCDAEDSAPIAGADPEFAKLLGLFDLPAFARRGQDLEYSLKRVRDRCREEREELLEMVRLRLRQWSRVACSPGDWKGIFSGPIDSLWCFVQAGEPSWASRPSPVRRKRIAARDLIASVSRFNERWRRFLESLNLRTTNLVIDQYNQYYVLEKECVMGSARLASRYFSPVSRLSPESLLEDYPLLPLPELSDS